MSDSTPPRTAQVLLGVFICWQLWFLVSSNLFGWLEDVQTQARTPADAEPTEASTTVEHLAPGFTRGEGDGNVMALAKWVSQTNKPWAHVTGQLQQWALFSGTYSRDCVFPGLIVTWNDSLPDAVPLLNGEELDWRRLLDKGDAEIAPRLILSPHEPANLDSYFRWRQMRMRRFENALHLALVPKIGATREELAEIWDGQIRDHLRGSGYLLTRYMKVKRKELESKWAGLPPPKQMILLARRVHTRDPDETPPDWTGPHVVPILLWEMGEGEGRFLRFDPMTGRFRSWE